MSQTHILLPPANEVWGKVISLHLSVILFTGGGVPGKVPTRAGTPPWQVTPPGRYIPPGRYPCGKYPRQCMLGYSQQAGGTHPTGNAFLLIISLPSSIKISSKIINVERLRNGITIISITILKFAETAVILPPAAIVVRGYCFHRRLSIHRGGVGMSLAMTTRCH